MVHTFFLDDSSASLQYEQQQQAHPDEAADGGSRASQPHGCQHVYSWQGSARLNAHTPTARVDNTTTEVLRSVGTSSPKMPAIAMVTS
ncbi:hypothetical protein Pcinc_029570 [Petrolisthes cinctipes]|uniref:Uncharacterized protein n=1 Tax=Petrolisthes cinctipes TaxID=88211 RepID=A0AAE1F0M7_PETCI|nr:hypothetical protein Pcinc_029570 [Petrolisthes cinctipes]